MKHFMEMDLNEFEEKEEDNFSSEDDSLDFDFDEAIDDVGTDDSSDESTDETTTDTTETQDDASGAENYEDKYIEELKKRKDQDPIQQLEIAVGAKLPKDFAEGVFIFDNNDFADSKIIKDDKVVFVVAEMWPLKRIISMRKNNNCYLNDDSIFAIGDDGFGNVIVLKTTDNTYHVWYHDTNKTIMIAKAFDEEGVDPGYNINEEDTLLYLLKSGMDSSNDEPTTDEASELEEDTTADTEEDVKQESYNFSIGSRKLSRFYQEDGEESTDDGDEELELPEAPSLEEGESEETEEVSVESNDNEGDTTETEIDISSFGTDTSDVQNDFDPKDVDRLNKLIAAESEAINDYFDASKDTRDEDLRTLFSDIGHEERFHLEQLMYSKSKITGEKYEPRDPEVKAEYEELVNGGMDEDTAASTAMDKSYMVGEDDGDDSDMEEIEQESVFINNMLYNNELLVSICEQYIDNPSINDKDVAVFIESFIMESIDNVSSAPKEVTKIKSPFSVLAKGLKMSINGLSRMSAVIRDSMRRSKLKRHRRSEWLKNHSVADLFKGGIYLYLYNDKESRMDFNTPVKYVDFLYRLTKAIGESCGIKLTAEAKHKTVKDPIKFKDINEGMYKLSQVLFTKTKVVVTDANKAAIQNEFFGYNDDKIKVGVTHGTDQIVHDSDNIYNKLNVMILVVKQYAEISEAVLNEMSKLEGDVNSVYYKNRPVYNKAKDNMSTVIKTYNQFISAMSHDLTQILKLDNGLLKLTRERDMTEQSGGKWEGEDIRVAPKQAPQGPQYTKRKK